MVRQIKTIPFHTFLLPVFFILHILNEYYGLLSGGIVLRYFGWYFLLSIVFFGIGRMLLKSNHKAALLSTVLLAIFFFWGAFHDYIKELGIAGFLTSYSFLLPLYGVLFVVFYILLRRMKNLTRITFFFNLLFVLFISITLIQIAGKAFSRTDINDLAAQNPPLPIKQQLIPDSLKPDIFFIVFDEYASSLALKKYFNFDNTPLDSMLKSNGFYVAENAMSNYNVTPLSISSTFNMQYFNRVFEKDQLLDAKEFQQGWHSLQESYIPRFFQLNGYKIKRFALDTEHGLAPLKFGSWTQRKILFAHTLAGRLERDLLWNYNFIPVVGIHNQSNYIKSIAEIMIHKQNILPNFNFLVNELEYKSDSPRFVYTHFLIPHFPYTLDRNGNPVTRSFSISGYTEQVLFVNTLVDQIVRCSKNNISRPKVLIIEGDHGYRGDTPVRKERETAFMNLNAFYFSDGDYKLLYDGISPVNTFRVILNKYFYQQLPILKDTSVFVY